MTSTFLLVLAILVLACLIALTAYCRYCCNDMAKIADKQTVVSLFIPDYDAICDSLFYQNELLRTESLRPDFVVLAEEYLDLVILSMEALAGRHEDSDLFKSVCDKARWFLPSVLDKLEEGNSEKDKAYPDGLLPAFGSLNRVLRVLIGISEEEDGGNQETILQKLDDACVEIRILFGLEEAKEAEK